MKGLFFQFGVLALAGVLAALGFIIAVGFLFAALCMYLAQFVSVAVAAALTAVIAIIVSLVVLLIGKLVVSRRTKKPESSAAIMGALLGKQLKDVEGLGVTKRLIIALVAGFAIGISPRLRRILFELL